MSAISEPTLLLDEQKVRSNIGRMSRKASRHALSLKPHFKTHQSIVIGGWFREYGVESITVSSVSMAYYFALNGWEDITIAFPLPTRQLPALESLSADTSLSILVSDPDALNAIDKEITNPLGIYIEIDTGSDRTGLKPRETDAIAAAIAKIKGCSKLTFKGFYSHPGHSYQARSHQQVKRIHAEAVQIMRNLKHTFQDAGTDIVCCLGDTPCCSIAEDWEGIDEMSPGNFVFYDLMQAQIGSATLNQIAVAMACPVVARYPKRNEVVVHGGAVHFSKEALSSENHTTIYGYTAQLKHNGSWIISPEPNVLTSVSQEHGVISCTDSFMNSTSVGDIVCILPVHSCLTADTMQQYADSQSMRIIDHKKGNHFNIY